MATWQKRFTNWVSKAFRLGRAVIEPADIAFGTDPERWSPEAYGNYIALSSAVYACVNLRSRNIASLPLEVFRDGQHIQSGPLVDLLSTVNPHWTPNRLWQMTMMALDLWGEAYWVLERGQDGRGVPKEIWWARPDRMRLVPDYDNYIQGWIYEWNNQRLAFSPGEVIWFRYPNPLDEFEGLSPIAATRLALDTGHAALKSNNAVFVNGVQLAGVVTPADKDTTWQRDQVEALRDMLERRFKGVDKAHRLAVLGQAASFMPLGISPKDAQFIELMKWTRSDACMVYGVPPELIGDQEGATYNNVKEAHKSFWSDTMMPIADMLAGELTEQLLPMFGEAADKAAFNFSGVAALQADMKEQAEQAKIWAEIGVPLNAILKELAPQFLNDGEGYPWGDAPQDATVTQEAVDEARAYEGISFVPPEAVRSACRKGLRLHEEGRSGDGLRPQTVREARQMAAGRAISPDKARRMRAWFARHAVDRRPGWDTPGKESAGYTAWLLWGGDAGRAWANRLVARMEAEDAAPAAKAIELGSAEHKAAYDEFGRRADRIMASFRREVVSLFNIQGESIQKQLAEQAAKALEDEQDVDAIFDEVTWGFIFADAVLDQIQIAAELGAVSTLQQLNVSTAVFDIDDPEVAAAMQARAQAFATQVNATTWDSLKTSLMQGIADGEGIGKLQKRVEAVMGDRIRSNSETIARTETIGALTEGSLMGAKQAEANGTRVKKAWLASFDGRERDSHAAAHRRYQRTPIALNEPFIVGGVQFDSPANPTGGRSKASASECINCRCAITYKVMDDTLQSGVLTSDAVAAITGWLNADHEG